MRNVLRRYSDSEVGDGYGHLRRRGRRRNVYAVRSGVAQGVVYQVLEDFLQPADVTLDVDVVVAHDRDLHMRGVRLGLLAGRHCIDQFRQGHVRKVVGMFYLLLLYLGERKHVADKRPKSCALAVYYPEQILAFLFRKSRSVPKDVNGALYRRQGAFQLVRDVCREFAAEPLVCGGDLQPLGLLVESPCQPACHHEDQHDHACTHRHCGAKSGPGETLRPYHACVRYGKPDNAAIDRARTVLLWKYTGDDIPSIMFNGTYIGAQHGYSLLIKIPNAGKTEADIGSVWENKNGQKYCLVKVVDGMLWLCPFDEDVMKDGDFSKYSKTRYAFVAAGDTLSHVEGATNTANIIATADAITNANDIQFYVSTIKIEQHLLLNGTVEIPVKENGVYEAEFIDIYEVYEIAYLPAVLTYLMENAGDNDNETCHSEEITETYMRFSTTHRYHRNGSCTVYQENEALKVLKNVDFYGMTSAAFADPSYVYVPGSVSAATMQKQEKVEFRVTGDANLVRDYYQFDDLLGTRGFAIGYYPYFGVATQENRPLAAGNGNPTNTNCGWYSAGQKNYPNLIKKAEMQPGEKIAFIGYRSPSVPIDDDFFAINWYFVGDEVMLLLNTDKAVGEKSVTLPDYLDGLTVTVAQKSDSFTVVSDTVDGGVTVSSTGAGYAILRLTPER